MQWDKELVGMFKVDPGSRLERCAQAAYRTYAKQMTDVFRKGLAGQTITASDLQGNCAAIVNGT